MLDEENFVELITGQLGCQRRNTLADHRTRERTFRLLGDLLGGRERLKTDFVPLGFALLGDQENLHDTLVSILAGSSEHSGFVFQLLDQFGGDFLR